MAQTDIYVDLNAHGNQFVNFGFERLATAPTSPIAGRPYFNTTSNTFQGWNGTAWIDLSQIITNPVTIKGEITNANTSPAYPSSPAIGDQYFITTTAGTVGGQMVEIGDMLTYGQSGWFVLQRNLQMASASIAGYIQLATQSEVNAGSDPNKAVTPQTLGQFLSTFLYSKKVVTSIASLAANTATTVTHGLGLVGASDLQVQCWLAGAPIGLAIATTSVNALTVTSNQALSNVNVVCIG